MHLHRYLACTTLVLVDPLQSTRIAMFVAKAVSVQRSRIADHRATTSALRRRMCSLLRDTLLFANGLTLKEPYLAFLYGSGAFFFNDRC